MMEVYRSTSSEDTVLTRLAPGEKNQLAWRVAITNKVPTSWASCTKCNQRRRGRCSECRLVKRLMSARGVGGGGRRDATGAGASKQAIRVRIELDDDEGLEGLRRPCR